MRRRQRNFIFLFFVLVCTNFLAFSQFVKRLDTKEGLINGTINVFEKDSLGYFWIGSDKGLDRYSGLEFRNYDLKSVTSLESVGIIDILNLNGSLYMLNPNGFLIKYNYLYDSFDKVFHLENKRFLSMAPLDKERILIGLDHGYIVFNLKSNRASNILHPETFNNRKIVVDNNLVYVATGRGCYIYKFDNEKETLSLKEISLEENDIISIALDSKKRLWIGTEIEGLFIKYKGKIKNLNINELQTKTYAVRKIEFDDQGNALVAIDRLGLFVIDEKLNITKLFSHDIDDYNSISQNSIYDVYVDDSNAYWLGLREGGINIIYQNDNIFSQISHVLNNANSINDNTIRAIYETKNGDLWFGTENGLTKYENHKFTNYNKIPKLYNTAVLAIAEYKNNILLGTYGESLLTFDMDNERLVSSSLEPKISSKLIFNISVFDDNLWIAVGNDGPLMHYNQDKFVNNYDVGLVRSFVQGYDQIYYAGSSTGFYEINTRNKGIRRLKEELFNNLNEIHNLNFDPLNNTIWIGSTNGLHKFNLSDESIENVGLITNNEIGTVFSIKRDNVQNLYLGTTTGLWRYDIKTKLFRRYDAQDGLFIEEFGTGASTQLSDGRLAFGGPAGAVIFQPIDLEEDSELADIYLSNFQINGKKPDSLTLNRNINFVKDLVLNYDQNSLSFNFETIKFHGSKRNRFEWKLKGYDENFRNVYGNEKITYSNLEPGNYVLFATGFNADGQITKNDYILNIKVKKPFWKTGVAFIFYFLITCFFALLLFKVAKANIQRRFNENRIKFFVEVAHDIRTPVSLIQLLVKQLSNQENVEKSIELLQRNSENLNEYVTQLLDFQKIDRKQLKLSVSKVDLNQCLSTITNDFTPILQEKSIDLTLDVGHIPVWFDTSKMNRIFYNLISNAIKYSNEGGEIKIRSYLGNNTLNIDFEDNGIGIPEDQQEQIFKRFTRGTNVSNKGIPGTGIGLMLSKKIVELHGGKILLESKENLGSKFTVVLPHGTEHYSSDELVNETQPNEKAYKVDDFINKDKLILLVEDNDELRGAIKNELAKDYSVMEASNGKEGLLIALSKSPDLIITDIMMPEMDGKELCNLLKTNFKTSHIPIIMLTALSDIDNKIQGLETGADAYVEKPFNIEVLKATINNLIKSRKNITSVLEEPEVKKQLTPDEFFLTDVINIIKKNIKENEFSIDDLCDIMGLSRSNLYRKLKGLIHMSPSDLIIKIKLAHAEEMMKNKTQARISDIAYESGFSDPKYFSTLFKKHYGMTPKEFIDEH